MLYFYNKKLYNNNSEVILIKFILIKLLFSELFSVFSQGYFYYLLYLVGEKIKVFFFENFLNLNNFTICYYLNNYRH